MKVISLLQPWASLMVSGSKQIETRSFFTSHRGRICIHASLGEEMLKTFFSRDPFYGHLTKLGFKTAADLPRGYIIGEVEIINCKLIVSDATPIITPIDKQTKMHKPKWDEGIFGDYTPGRFGWITNNFIKYDKPIPAKVLGLWNTDLVK